MLFVRPAVEETVDTIEGGGDGEPEREEGAGVDGDPTMVVSVVLLMLVLREGRVRVEFAVPKSSYMLG